MGKYQQTLEGEAATCRADDVSDNKGEQFCLRISLGDITTGKLCEENCFYVYLDETFEKYSIRQLLQTYFIEPSRERVIEMEGWLLVWKSVAPNLTTNYQLLRQMFAKVEMRLAGVDYHINHGPSHFDLDDKVESHLRILEYTDNRSDEKILDIVLEFHFDNVETLPEQSHWQWLGSAREEADVDIRTSRSPARSKSHSVSPDPDRRSILGRFVGFLIFVIFILILRNTRCNRGANKDAFRGGEL